MKLFLFFILLVSSSAVSTLVQTTSVTLSGTVKETKNKAVLPFVNVTLLVPTDSAFVTGAITNEEGLFSISGVRPGSYYQKLLPVINCRYSGDWP